MTATPQAMGIGLVGLGSITNAHRAGYHRFGLPVVAGYDPALAARQRFAEAEPDARVYDTLDDLLADPAVAVVDLATPHHREARIEPMRRIAAAGKPVFVQKPLAMTYADAEELAAIAAEHNLPTMVNQNMCFTPGGLLLPKLVVDDGAIGRPLLGQMTLRMRFDCPEEHWFGKDRRWWTAGHTVHHLAVLHMAFGPPATVYALLGRDPNQRGVTHEGYGHLALTYPDGLHILVLSSGIYYGARAESYGQGDAYFQGTDAVLDWQAEGASTLSRLADLHAGELDQRRQRLDTPGQWFPDAFGLAMHHFQSALRAGERPWCDIEDNLYVMAVVEAAYRSAEGNTVVPLREIMGDRYRADYGPGYRHGHRAWSPPTPSA